MSVVKSWNPGRFVGCPILKMGGNKHGQWGQVMDEDPKISAVGMVVPFFNERGEPEWAVLSIVTSTGTRWILVSPEHPPREIVLDDLPPKMLEAVLMAKRDYEKHKDAVVQKFQELLESGESGESGEFEEFDVGDEFFY